MQIIDTDHPKYQALRKGKTSGIYNGAYYYSKEIVKNIIPNVETDRNWDTLGMRSVGSLDHSLVFIHHGINMDEVYGWLDKYDDQILVVSTEDTKNWAEARGKKYIYLPLSVDVEYVKQFKNIKTRGACYAGNRWAFKRKDEDELIPSGVDFPPKNIPREQMLRFIAPYQGCYAIGRCAIEAKILGCEVKVCLHKYPDPEHWRVIDNKEAAKMLQKELDKIEEEK